MKTAGRQRQRSFLAHFLRQRLFPFCLLFLCALTLIGSALPITVLAGKLDDRRTVKVGYYENYSIIRQEQDHTYTGYGYEYLKEISKHTNWDYQFIPGTWDQCVSWLEDGTIDLLGPLQRSDARKERFDFPKYGMGTEYGVLYAPDDREDLFYEDFEGIQSLRIGRVTGNYFNEVFENYCQRYHIAPQYQDYETVQLLREGLEAGQVDAVVCGSITTIRDVKILARFALEPFYFATTKGNTQLLQELDIAIQKIKTNDNAFENKLYDKYFQNNVSAFLAFTKEEQAYLDTQPTLRMLFNANWAPMEYADAETGSFRGITADLMREISAFCGIRFQTVACDSYSDSLNSLETGQGDLLAGYVKMNTPRLDAALEITDPYLEIPIVMVGSLETETSADLRIALPHSFSQISQYVADRYGGDSIDYYNSLEECLEAVQKGEADMTLMNSYQFDQQTRQGRKEKLYVISVANISFPMCIGVSKSLDPAVVSILNKAIDRLSAEKMSTIILNNTTEADYPLPLSRVLRDYLPYLLVVGVFLLLIIVVIVLVNMRRSKLRLQGVLYWDKLTGIPTQEKFKLDAKRLLDKLGPHHFAVLALDIDRFKDINDMFGYQAGDDTLTFLAHLFYENKKEEELFARASSDHFIMLMAEQRREEISARIHRLYHQLLNQNHKQQEIYNLVVNAGVYIGTPADNDINFMIDRANIARKTIKGGHQSALAFYTEEIHQRVEKEKEIERAMSGALRNREFVVYYQPKYRISDQTLVGAEALVRWKHPEKGLIPPMDFIPLFERNGFIVNLDLFVFEEVCAKLREWLSNGRNPPPISVNLSRLHLRSVNFISRFQAIRDKYNLPDHLLELELTETAVLDARSNLSVIMNRLRESGFLLSMDDFGAGYSSLNLLRELPVDVLKLDRAFFEEEKASYREQVIIRNIVQMAKELQIQVLAEGVETGEQLEFLQRIGCDMVQGYLFGRPMPLEEFEQLAFGHTKQGKQTSSQSKGL